LGFFWFCLENLNCFGLFFFFFGGVFGALWVFGAFVCSSRREEDLAAGGGIVCEF